MSKKIIFGTILFEDIKQTHIIEVMGIGKLKHPKSHCVAHIQKGFREEVFTGEGDIEAYAEKVLERTGEDYVIPYLFTRSGGHIVMPEN